MTDKREKTLKLINDFKKLVRKMDDLYPDEASIEDSVCKIIEDIEDAFANEDMGLCLSCGKKMEDDVDIHCEACYAADLV
jgi:hypothetical protein